MTETTEVDYSAVIADLEAKRKLIDDMLTGLRVLAGLRVVIPEGLGQSLPSVANGGTKPPESTTEIQSDTFFGLSLPAAARKYLEMNKRPKPTNDICDALLSGGILTKSNNFYATMHAVLRRDPSFTQVNRDWALAEWYSGRGKQKQ